MWAVEGSNGTGRPLAQRLLADGEHVVDVPAKLSARARLLDTGHNRKTDAHDAHAVAVVAVRTKSLRVLAYDADLEVLRMLVDRRDELSKAKVQASTGCTGCCRNWFRDSRKKDMTAFQAKAILAAARPRDPVRKTLKRLALEQLAELMVIEKKIKASSKELKALVLARGSHLMDLTGVGPVVAARILADVGDVARFADRNRFASWTGTAPLDASSGEQIRHRLSRAGNRKANHVIHIAAVNQIRLDSPGRAYYRRKLAAGKTPMEAMRCLKRRISDALYRQLRPSRRRHRARGRGPGRALRGVTHIQRGRLAPAHRHFGSATSRTRTNDATRATDEAEDRHSKDPPTHPLTSEGCRSDAGSSDRSRGPHEPLGSGRLRQWPSADAGRGGRSLR